MPWADNNGFEYFIKAFRNLDFLYALRNTLLLNVLDLVIGFPAPIILALLLNELTFPASSALLNPWLTSPTSFLGLSLPA